MQQTLKVFLITKILLFANMQANLTIKMFSPLLRSPRAEKNTFDLLDMYKTELFE